MRRRAAARAIFDSALAAAAVRPLVLRALAAVTPPAGRVVVVGAGKASGAMASAVEEAWGDRVAGGLVVVKDGHLAETRRVQLVEAGHPVPDERGAAAARDLLALALGAGAEDLVLALISGGASALTPAPAPPITLGDKQVMTRLLLAAGADINQLNAVRKHCSVLKGGQLARAAAPARVAALLLSDVIGDPIDVIGSGPTAPDASTFGEALGILDRFDLRQRAPASVRDRLERGARGEIAETPKPDDSIFDAGRQCRDREQSARRRRRRVAGRRARAGAARVDAVAARRGARRRARAGGPRRARSRRAAGRWRRPPA